MSRLTLIFVLLCLPFAALGQNLFAPVAKVNDRVVTGYELEQRILFNRILRAPGDVEELSLTQLIDDRLRLDAANIAGIAVTDEEVAEGMDEFAGRANLTREEFVSAIGAAGIEEQAFRDFVRAGVAWRGVVRQRFLARVNITEDEIDRAIALSTSGSGVRVLLSEIILPANTPANAQRSEALAQRLSEIEGEGAFAAAARRNSVSPTRGRGGRLEWLPLGNLPPQLRPIVLALRPGEVSAPIPIPNAIALFQLRAIEETEAPDTEISAIEYAAFYIPGGRNAAALAEAERIRTRVDTCDDLYGVAKGLPEERLERGALPPAEVPGDIALELAKLDDGEVSTALTRADGQTLVFLMLCGRTPAIGEEIDREEIRARLRSQRIDSLANSYLAQLRADALIQRF